MGINAHFRREGIAQAFIVALVIIIAALAAVIGPWVFEHLH
jgi:hypothetical protein